jgi:hypothetical protein
MDSHLIEINFQLLSGREELRDKNVNQGGIAARPAKDIQQLHCNLWGRNNSYKMETFDYLATVKKVGVTHRLSVMDCKAARFSGCRKIITPEDV